MQQKQWDIQVGNGFYRIDFFHSIIFKPKYKVFVNDEKCNDTSVVLDKIGADYHFEIDGHKCAILFRVISGIKSSFDISIDGISFTTKQNVVLLEKKKRF